MFNEKKDGWKITMKYFQNVVRPQQKPGGDLEYDAHFAILVVIRPSPKLYRYQVRSTRVHTYLGQAASPHRPEPNSALTFCKVDIVRDLMSPVGKEMHYKNGMKKDADGFTDIDWCSSAVLNSWDDLRKTFRAANARKAIAPTQVGGCGGLKHGASCRGAGKMRSIRH